LNIIYSYLNLFYEKHTYKEIRMNKTLKTLTYLAWTLTTIGSTTDLLANDDFREDNKAPLTRNYALEGVNHLWEASKNAVYAAGSLGYDVVMFGNGAFKGASAAIHACSSLIADKDETANIARKEASINLKEAKDDIYKGITNIPTALSYLYKATTSLGYGLYDLGVAGTHGVQTASHGLSSGWNYVSQWWQTSKSEVIHKKAKVENDDSNKALILYKPRHIA